MLCSIPHGVYYAMIGCIMIGCLMRGRIMSKMCYEREDGSHLMESYVL